jgi:hypothetical protein
MTRASRSDTRKFRVTATRVLGLLRFAYLPKIAWIEVLPTIVTVQVGEEL